MAGRVSFVRGTRRCFRLLAVTTRRSIDRLDSKRAGIPRKSIAAHAQSLRVVRVSFGNASWARALLANALRSRADEKLLSEVRHEMRARPTSRQVKSLALNGRRLLSLRYYCGKNFPVPKWYESRPLLGEAGALAIAAALESLSQMPASGGSGGTWPRNWGTVRGWISCSRS